ncbi:MAG: SoxR reducing system RseC family protein [Bacteroidales bacterium]
MSTGTAIDHEGIVVSATGELARVRIVSQSACASCHAKGACSASDQEEKEVDVTLQGEDVRPGEKVRVLVARHLGYKAVALGYFFPFLLVLGLLILLTSLGLPELRAGTAALGSVVPYYLILYLFRKRIETRFQFRIQKIHTVQ